MKKSKKPLISVITPTYNRSCYHERLYRSFTEQTYPNKELLILDDTEKPSEFFSRLEDKRVTYIHSQARLNIGEKRNRLLDLAQGEIIAHFDDDDLYAPKYLAFMAKALGKDYTLVKLASWLAYHRASKEFFYWNTPIISPLHFVVDADSKVGAIAGADHFDQNFLTSTIWGFGFSYLYRKSVYPKIIFTPEDSFGEDLHFIQKIKREGLLCRAINDTQGLAAHVIHGSNMSRIFPQFRLPAFVSKRLFPSLEKMTDG